MRGRGSPTTNTAGRWTAIATAVKQTPAGDLPVDLAIRHDTGGSSAMTVGSRGAATLTTRNDRQWGLRVIDSSPTISAPLGTSSSERGEIPAGPAGGDRPADQRRHLQRVPDRQQSGPGREA